MKNFSINALTAGGSFVGLILLIMFTLTDTKNPEGLKLLILGLICGWTFYFLTDLLTYFLYRRNP